MIKEFQSIKELLTALRDAAKAHRSLFEKAEILHREWGHLNPERADGFTGMLIDLDLAIEDGKRTVGRLMYSAESSIPTDMIWNRSSRCYCGYVLVARGKENSNAAQETGPGGIFWGGCMGSMAADVADAKLWNMHTDGFKGILEEFVPTI